MATPRTSFRFDNIQSQDDVASWITKNPKDDLKKQGQNIYIGAAIGQMGPRVQMCRFLGPRCRIIKVHDVMDGEKKSGDERTISFFLPGGADQEKAITTLSVIQKWASLEVKKKWADKWNFPIKRSKTENDALAAKGHDIKQLTDEEVEKMNSPQPGVWGGSILARDREDDTKFAPMMRVKGYFKEIADVEESPYEKLIIGEDGEIRDRCRIQPTEFLKLIEQVGTEFVPTIEFVKIYRKNFMWQIAPFLVGGIVVPIPKRENKTITDPDEEALIKALMNKGKRKASDECEETPDAKQSKTQEIDSSNENSSPLSPPPPEF